MHSFGHLHQNFYITRHPQYKVSHPRKPLRSLPKFHWGAVDHRTGQCFSQADTPPPLMAVPSHPLGLSIPPCAGSPFREHQPCGLGNHAEALCSPLLPSAWMLHRFIELYRTEISSSPPAITDQKLPRSVCQNGEFFTVDRVLVIPLWSSEEGRRRGKESGQG